MRRSKWTNWMGIEITMEKKSEKALGVTMQDELFSRREERDAPPGG